MLGFVRPIRRQPRPKLATAPTEIGLKHQKDPLAITHVDSPSRTPAPLHLRGHVHDDRPAIALEPQTLFGMGNNLGDAVGVAVDGEVKAPIVIDAGLPSAFSLVKLLSVERGVVQVANQIVDLLDEGFLDRQRCVEQPLDGGLRKVDVHPNFLDLAALAVLRIFFLRKAATSAPSLNGP